MPGRIQLGGWLLLATAVTPCGAGAQVTVIDQYPAIAAFGFSAVADSNCTFGSPNRALSQADDFVVSAPVAIDQVDFQGQFLSSTAPSDPTSFRLRILNDAAGLPGALVAEPAIAVSQALALQSNTSLYDITATFSPVALNPGTYWLELFETDDTSANCFGWQVGPFDASRGRDGKAVDLNNAPGTSWTLQGGVADTVLDDQDELSMRITGEAALVGTIEIPTLAPWGIAALAAALALGALGRLRRCGKLPPRHG